MANETAEEEMERLNALGYDSLVDEELGERRQQGKEEEAEKAEPKPAPKAVLPLTTNPLELARRAYAKE